ncbi:retrovirus-related pol polyprotein from transposon TNT 1-94 [Tanacetum coccineum]
MSNTNLQTQTSNSLYNAIMEAGGKDRPPMLAPGNYNPPYKFKWTEKTVPVAEGSSETTTEGYMENYKNVSQDIRNQLDAEAEAVQIILTGINNDIYSIFNACPNACEMWKAIERLKQGESINVHDFEINLYWEFRKFTSRDGESLKSYYSRFVTLVKQSQELKTVSYHKLYDILKQHQNEVNELRAERLACTANPLALVAQQQPVYHPQNHPTHYTHNSSTRTQQVATRNKGKAIKIYKPTNNNLKTSSNTSKANQDNTPRINRGTGYDNQRAVNVAGARKNVGTHVVQQSGIQCYNCKEYRHVARECQKLKRAKDAAYHKKKMLLCKQEKTGFQLNIQEVTPDAAHNSGPIINTKPLQKVQNDEDNYNVFANDREHPKQPKSVNYTYLEEQGDTNITIDSLDMSTNGDNVDQDDDDLARERDLLSSLIDKLKCEINNSKNRNKFLESSNKALVDKLKGEIEDFKTKNKSLESLNNHFKEANNELSKTNQLMFKDLKKFQAELDRYHDVNYASNFLKKAQRGNPRLYDIGYYNVNLALMLAPESDETIRLAQILPQNVKSILKNTNVIASGMYKVHTKPNQTRLPQLPQDIRKTNKRVSFYTGVIPTTSVSRPQLKSNHSKDRVLPNNSQGKNQEVEDHRRNFNTREPKRNVNQSAATPLKRTVATESNNQKPRSKIRKQYKQISKTCKWWYSKITPPGYKWKPKTSTVNVKPNVSMPLGIKSRTTTISEPMTLRNSTISNTPSSFNSFAARRYNSIHHRLGCLEHMTGNLKLLNLVQGNVTIKRVYYVERLNHTLFSVGQFCDADLKVAFRKSTCYICDLKGNDLLTASSSHAWLWHCHLSHLNFDTIKLLLKYDIVTGLPKLKFVKDHLCYSCEFRKAKQDFMLRVRKVDCQGTKFLNKNLHAYFAQEGIEHQTSTARTPEQNGIVERRNRTLVEADRTMLSAAKVPLFF